MAFFSKLKDRLFKSSHKLEEGLDAIVQDGGTPDAQDAAHPDDKGVSDEAIGNHAEAQSPEAENETSSTAKASAGKASAAKASTAGANAAEAGNSSSPGTKTPEDNSADGARADDASPATTTLATDAGATAPPSDLGAAIDRVTSQSGSASDQPPKTKPAKAKPPKAKPDQPSPTPGPRENQSASPGLMSRLMGRRAAAPVTRRALDDDMLEQLEELLIASDMGVDTALRVAANMAEGRMGKRLSTDEIKSLLADEITRIMDPVAKPLPIFPKKPQVVLVVGVNGSGKTTTIGKLASQFRAAGKSVIIAAGDTFRAAAVEQLEIWGERAGVPVLKAEEGSDPAALAFDAMQKAEDDGADLLLIDTAGRLQNRADLMEELAKIVRVIRKKDQTAPHNTLLVLDATTGQNALSQVDTFQKMSDVSGLVMTKLDGTAKGGVLVALADKFGLPIHAIGVGEQIDDLAPFDPADFARALTGAQ